MVMVFLGFRLLSISDVPVNGQSTAMPSASTIVGSMSMKAKVTLIEKNKMGGDCLNTGCVPSKALIRSAKLASDMKRGASLGFSDMEVDFNFSDVMDRVQRIIKQIEPHDSVERFESLGVDVEIGEAEILSPYLVSTNGKVLSTRNIIIATGAEPFIPPIKNLDQVEYLTSDNVWELQEQPGRLVVLGGGPIGTELAQTFNRLGSQVTQVEMLPQIMTREDPEIAEMVAKTMRSEGVTILAGYTAMEVMIEDGEKYLLCKSASKDEDEKVPFDEILVAVACERHAPGQCHQLQRPSPISVAIFQLFKSRK